MTGAGLARDVSLSAPAGHSLSAAAKGGLGSAAAAQLAAVARLSGLTAGQLRLRTVRSDATGTDVTYQQTAARVPIHGAVLVASLDRAGAVIAVNGRVSGIKSDSAGPKTTAAAAQGTSLQHLAARYHRPSTTMAATGSRVEWYDPSVAGTGTATGQLVYTVTVLPRSGGVHGEVLVSANTGAMVADETANSNDITRAMCDANNTNIAGQKTCSFSSATRAEGQGATGIADVDQAYTQFGSASSYYSTQLGVDLTSLIGYNNGSRKYLSAIVRACDFSQEPDCPMQNAYWNGYGMAFGQGFTGADDVITHELTHGVTQFTNNLQYSAMNEGMSDIMGELEDQLDGTGNDSASVAWLIGEDLPASIGVIRDMSNPPASKERGPHPDRIGSPQFSLTGDGHGMSGPMSKTAYLISHGGAFNGRTVTGIGLTKSAKLWWKVEKTLTAYSQYKSLNTVLASACSSLQSSAVLTASDCTQVTNAKAATELTLATR